VNWWDRTEAGGEPSPSHGLRSAARSVYEDRAEPTEPPKILVSDGHIVGYEIDGQFVKAQPCCENPLECERPECWWPLPGIIGG
jgi:hypothetical protein